MEKPHITDINWKPSHMGSNETHPVNELISQYGNKALWSAMWSDTIDTLDYFNEANIENPNERDGKMILLLRQQADFLQQLEKLGEKMDRYHQGLDFSDH